MAIDGIKGPSSLANSFLQNKATAPTAAPAQMPTITQPVQTPMDFGSMAPRQPIQSAAPKPFTLTPQAQFLLAMGAPPKQLLGDNYNAWASAPVTQGQLYNSQQSSRGGYGGQASRYRAGGGR